MNPIDELLTEMDGARSRYYNVTKGATADKRWSIKSINARIEQFEAEQAEAQAKADARQAAKAKAEAERDALSAERGTLEEYASQAMSRGEEHWKLGSAASFAVRAIEVQKESAKKLMERFEADPLDALSWGDSYFTAAAEYTVAMEFKHMLEAGCWESQILDYAMTETLRGAKNPSRSTSPTSNLASTAKTAAWARLTGMLQNGGMY